MESDYINNLSINLPNYEGPLEVLLDLAKTQKVDLAEISVTKLADQFLEFIKNNEKLNLETATEFLLMASWLAYLKSKLLLPEDDEEDFKALEVAEIEATIKKIGINSNFVRSNAPKKTWCAYFYTRHEGWHKIY